jgi:hypothetical protein
MIERRVAAEGPEHLDHQHPGEDPEQHATRVRTAPEECRGGEEEPLLAFSVPSELAGEARWEARRGAWLQELQAAVAAAAGRGFPWCGALLHVQQSQPRPIAL